MYSDILRAKGNYKASYIEKVIDRTEAIHKCVNSCVEKEDEALVKTLIETFDKLPALQRDRAKLDAAQLLVLKRCYESSLQILESIEDEYDAGESLRKDNKKNLKK